MSNSQLISIGPRNGLWRTVEKPLFEPMTYMLNGTSISYDLCMLYASSMGTLSDCSKGSETNWKAVNTLRPRQNCRHFTDNVFKCIFVNANCGISRNIQLKFVPKDQALVQIMAWWRPCDQPFCEPRMISLLTHICVTQPHWVKQNR